MMARSIVVAALNDGERAILGWPVLDSVDEAMLGIDPAGPTTLQIAAQRLRLPDSVIRGPEGILDEAVDSRPHPSVGDPPLILLPCRLGERQPHPSIPISPGST